MPPARPLRILMISSEVESLARTGGLGDVVEALSLAHAELGHDVIVVTVEYRLGVLGFVRGQVPANVLARGQAGDEPLPVLPR